MSWPVIVCGRCERGCPESDDECSRRSFPHIRDAFEYHSYRWMIKLIRLLFTRVEMLLLVWIATCRSQSMVHLKIQSGSRIRAYNLTTRLSPPNRLTLRWPAQCPARFMILVSPPPTIPRYFRDRHHMSSSDSSPTTDPTSSRAPPLRPRIQYGLVSSPSSVIETFRDLGEDLPVPLRHRTRQLDAAPQ